MRFKTVRNLVVGAVASTLSLAAMGATASMEVPAIMEGSWKSACTDISEGNNQESLFATFICSATECKSKVEFYSGRKCEGSVTSSESNTFKYEIERLVKKELYDIKILSAPDPACYGRIKISKNKMYFFVSAEEGDANDCSTPAKRIIKIDEEFPYTKQ